MTESLSENIDNSWFGLATITATTAHTLTPGEYSCRAHYYNTPGAEDVTYTYQFPAITGQTYAVDIFFETNAQTAIISCGTGTTVTLGGPSGTDRACRLLFTTTGVIRIASTIHSTG